MSITPLMPRARHSERVLPEPPDTVAPRVFDPSLRADREALHRLRSSGQVTRTVDLLPDLLDELATLRTPAAPSTGAGCWVFYPWSGRLVRTLRADLWRTLRSDRNRYKLTTSEQHRLQGATVAVAGLSVGAAVVHVMALEGTGGTLRLADADVLAGSNCNRVRASMWDLGQAKAVLAARMVWELDPFRSVERDAGAGRTGQRRHGSSTAWTSSSRSATTSPPRCSSGERRGAADCRS